MNTNIIIHDDYIEFTDKTWTKKLLFIIVFILGTATLVSVIKSGFDDYLKIFWSTVYLAYSIYYSLTSSYRKTIKFEDIESVHINKTWNQRIKFKLKNGKSRRVFIKCDSKSYELIKESLNVDVKYSKI
ncbi:hypothetical protein [Psychroflexus aestuariivivens]|uniref:hypothetical protein n=1 Tax=Psychroflexus aestuariivivens TaxID=1795040 RepID=UPI000FDB784E|nr:hypothetical protein [Psychroflexus aestuariivivens]